MQMRPLFEGETIDFAAQLSDGNHSNEELEATWYMNDMEVCSASSPDSNGISYCSIVIDLQTTKSLFGLSIQVSLQIEMKYPY